MTCYWYTCSMCWYKYVSNKVTQLRHVMTFLSRCTLQPHVPHTSKVRLESTLVLFFGIPGYNARIPTANQILILSALYDTSLYVIIRRTFDFIFNCIHTTWSSIIIFNSHLAMQVLISELQTGISTSNTGIIIEIVKNKNRYLK